MLETDTRKRPSHDSLASPPSKKRALAGENGSPVLVNGAAPAVAATTEGDEPREQDDVEHFRKEAIWRRMKHYSREAGRNSARVAELERVRQALEGALAAIGSSWEQIVEALRDSSQQTDDSGAGLSAQELLELVRERASGNNVELDQIFQAKADATKALISRITQSQRPDESHSKVLDAQSQLAALRAQIAVSQEEFANMRSQRDELHQKWQLASAQCDRANSRTVQATHPRVPDNAGDDAEAKGTEGTPMRVSPPPALSTAESNEEMQRIRDERDAVQASKLSLEQEVARLRDELQSVKADASRNPIMLSEEQVQTNPFYQAMVHKAASLAEAKHASEVVSDERAKQLAELTKMYEGERATFEADHAVALRNLNDRAKKCDEDLARIRGLRDEAVAMNRELKAREDLKWDAIKETQKQSDNRGERIAVLQSELARVKSLVAAKAGDEALVAFFTSEKEVQERLTQAERKVKAMEESLKSLRDEKPDLASHIQAELAAKQELALVRDQLAAADAQLTRYRSTYGESSSLPPQMRDLSEQLRHKEEELKALRVQNSQHEQGEAAMYTELDALTAAWEKAEQQLKSKVFELKGMEEQMRRVATERAKLENRVYAAVNAKDAAISEAKALKRTHEKEQKVIATLQEAKTQQDQLITQTRSTLAESESVKEAIQRRELTARQKVKEVEKELAKSNALLQKSEAKTRAVQHDHTQSERARRTAEEQAKVARAEAERLRAALKSRPETSSGKEDALQQEVDQYKQLLKCSTCGHNHRQVYLAKCSHTFCRPCIETRYASRQRKCPSCQVAFGQADIQTLYFQG